MLFLSYHFPTKDNNLSYPCQHDPHFLKRNYDLFFLRKWNSTFILITWEAHLNWAQYAQKLVVHDF